MTPLHKVYRNFSFQCISFHQLGFFLPLPITHFRIDKRTFGSKSHLSFHRYFFDSLAQEFSIRSLEDWYKIDQARALQRARGILKNHYQSSLFNALVILYPEHHWVIWKFEKVSVGYWKNKRNQRVFFDWVRRI